MGGKHRGLKGEDEVWNRKRGKDGSCFTNMKRETCQGKYYPYVCISSFLLMNSKGGRISEGTSGFHSQELLNLMAMKNFFLLVLAEYVDSFCSLINLGGDEYSPFTGRL